MHWLHIFVHGVYFRTQRRRQLVVTGEEDNWSVEEEEMARLWVLQGFETYGKRVYWANQLM